MSIKMPKEANLILMCRQIAFIGHYHRYESYKRDTERNSIHKWGARF